MFVLFIGFIHAKSSNQNTPLPSCSSFLSDEADEPRLSRADLLMMTVKEFKSRLPQNFWSKIAFGKLRQCWNWTAYIDCDGYGHYSPTGDKRLRTTSHRYAYMQLFGMLTSKIYVLHKCDNPACCNPNHLFHGTQFDNMQDMVKKGRKRFPIGADALAAKLTDDEVRGIRNRLSNGDRQIDIAKAYGITQVRVSQIKLNKCWTHIKP